MLWKSLIFLIKVFPNKIALSRKPRFQSLWKYLGFNDVCIRHLHKINDRKTTENETLQKCKISLYVWSDLCCWVSLRTENKPLWPKYCIKCHHLLKFGPTCNSVYLYALPIKEIIMYISVAGMCWWKDSLAQQNAVLQTAPEVLLAEHSPRHCLQMRKCRNVLSIILRFHFHGKSSNPFFFTMRMTLLW